jgi:hypothetical protein
VIPDGLSILSAASKNQWHCVWTLHLAFDWIWGWRQPLFQRNGIFEY